MAHKLAYHIIPRGAQLLEMGTLIPHRSFTLPAGAFSLNLSPKITLCRVQRHVDDFFKITYNHGLFICLVLSVCRT